MRKAVGTVTLCGLRAGQRPTAGGREAAAQGGGRPLPGGRSIRLVRNVRKSTVEQLHVPPPTGRRQRVGCTPADRRSI
ncbi:hypothetical protein GCM10011360_04580 [Primorskyibacter flagellatus]|uniref:Uncharacterized protein n=1 Tax=Primorskyibacter flagellatus TaxID=1387277 RepID=A0A916ZY81_9RHOB|nr:hypothetical protein GCM10011360_04580 [Primorskyibacter flagellatus]